MNVFLVGGAVRDQLMGRVPKDCDYVVVGSTPESMLAQGFRQVGKDFPVFLHPKTKDEYALARTERKTGQGYGGFTVHASPEVTLEEDLARRDLTINAMAQSADGQVIDPFGGQRDLAEGVLRHVGPAFSDDPVRILRMARFAARYAGFSVAPETMALMRDMVAAGELDHLVAERVWQEFSRGLMEAKPSRMLQVLRECGALARLLPEVDRLFGIPQPLAHHPEGDVGTHILLVLDRSAHHGFPLETRFGALMHDLGKGLTPSSAWPRHHDHEALGVEPVRAVCDRWKVPAMCREVAVMATAQHGRIHHGGTLTASSMVSLLSQLDAFRRPDRLRRVLEVGVCDQQGRTGCENHVYEPFDVLLGALDAARQVDCGAIARAVRNQATIPDQIHAARVGAVKVRLASR